MSSHTTARSLGMAFLLTVALAVSACGGATPTPTPGAKASQAPINPTLVTPSTGVPTINPSLVGTPLRPNPNQGPVITVPPAGVTPQAAAPLSYSKDIQPLLNQRCSACHVSQSQGGLSVKDYNSLLKGGQNGSPVVKGDPDKSLLVRKLRGDPAVGVRMPVGGPYLSDAEISKVADWIKQGTNNN